MSSALEASVELDPLPNVLPHEGVVVTRLSQIVERAARERRTDVAGVRGCADALVIASMAAAGPVVAVTEDLDGARRLAQDVRFLLGSKSRDEEEMEDTDDVLVLTTSETSPYADVNPDRRSGMSRMATLAHIACKRPWRVLVVCAAALVRKLVPRDVVRAHSHRVVHEDELDRDRLVKQLTDAGYLRVPVVEDPGSLAVRGALLDVWPPGADGPARIEL